MKRILEQFVFFSFLRAAYWYAKRDEAIGSKSCILPQLRLLESICYFCTMGKIVALDFGLKRTGIAMTDALRIIASPLTTIDSANILVFLTELTNQHEIDVLVLGIPKTLGNEDTHITQNVYLLKDALQQAFPKHKIALVDERFTSKMAMQSMVDNGMKKKQRKEKGMVDQISAAIILQSYLEQIR
jgi:putative Holliday junction resolvase